ncbi:MAG TPA: hypothetical protein VIF09_16870 [Polyangiaceae bacterium]|jgi:hypothetical protein
MRPIGILVRGASAAALAVVLLGAPSARAQAPSPAPSHDKVAAEALFEDGRRLAAAGSFAEACPKFADSQRLDPSAGTLLNLASCYEKLGRSATAWATYREAASAANAAGRADYVATAQRHAEALAPHLAHLTVAVAQPVDGMVIVRDGARVEHAEWGVAIPIDAGSHTLEVTAPGHKGWSTRVEVAADGTEASATIPALEALPVEVAPPPSGVAPPSPAPPAPETSSGGGQRVLGVIVGGVGIVGLGVAGAFAIVAKNQYNTSLGNCQPGDPNACNGTGVSQRDTARSSGNAASIAAAVGGAALVGGAVIWLTAPHSGASASVRVGVAPTLGGALVQGAW